MVSRLLEKRVPPENPKVSLGDLRDLLIIVGIFLFFTGWVYNYYFYDYFGLSLSQVHTDYSTFLVYSFLVIISNHYLPLAGIIILFLVYMQWLRHYMKITVICALILFPGLYLLAKSVANQN